MKTEQKIEIYRELFGSFPDVPEGKELIGIECKPPKQGDYYYDDGWEISDDSYDSYAFPVAIFQDTHREDGTPTDIDPLPEPPEGYRVEYAGMGMTDMNGADSSICINPNRAGAAWSRAVSGQPYCNNSLHYARLYKIAQPTTLADLVGKHGQNNVWLHTEDGCLTQAIIASTPCQPLALRGADEKWHEVADLLDSRWSHSPFTTWADAKEFVPEK